MRGQVPTNRVFSANLWAMSVLARNILLVDDHALLQHALASMLQPLLSGGRIQCASCAQEAMAVLRGGAAFHLILLDLKLPDSDGLRLVESVRRAAPGVPIAIFSGQDAPIYRQLARRADLHGFLSKSMPPAALTDAIRALLSGRHFFDDQVEPRQGGVQRGTTLSSRQQRVLCCLMEGLSNKEIALRLSLSERTIKMHLTAIFQALNVNSRAQAILVGQSLGLTMPEEDD